MTSAGGSSSYHHGHGIPLCGLGDLDDTDLELAIVGTSAASWCRGSGRDLAGDALGGSQPNEGGGKSECCLHLVYELFLLGSSVTNGEVRVNNNEVRAMGNAIFQRLAIAIILLVGLVTKRMI